MTIINRIKTDFQLLVINKDSHNHIRGCSFETATHMYEVTFLQVILKHSLQNF